MSEKIETIKTDKETVCITTPGGSMHIYLPANPDGPYLDATFWIGGKIYHKRISPYRVD